MAATSVRSRRLSWLVTARVAHVPNSRTTTARRSLSNDSHTRHRGARRHFVTSALITDLTHSAPQPINQTDQLQQSGYRKYWFSMRRTVTLRCPTSG
jgi:hypothetical protein